MKSVMGKNQLLYGGEGYSIKKIFGMFAEIEQTKKNAEIKIGRAISDDAFYFSILNLYTTLA